MHNGGLQVTTYVVAILCIAFYDNAEAAGDAYSVSMLYGQKYLDQGDWGAADSQREFGVGVTFQQPDVPVLWVGNLSRSRDAGTDSTNFEVPLRLSGQTTELSGGARKNLTEGASKVFVEGGLLYISASLKGVDLVTGDSVRDSDSALGLWLGGGLDFMITHVMSAGGLIRMSLAKAGDGALGGTHFGLYAAYHFRL